MTRFLDLTAVSAVEGEMKDWLEPFLESQKETQKLVQGFFDTHQASVQAAAYALTGVTEAMAGISKSLPLQEITASYREIQSATYALTGTAEAAARISNVLPWQEITESYREMQKLTDLAKFSLDLPKITPIEPIRFGHLCVEVMEDEDEMIPALIPDRRVTAEDRRLIALEVVQILKQEGLVVAADKKEEPKLLPAPNIQKIVLVKLEKRQKIRVVINGNYQGAFERSLGKYWNCLLRIAEQEQFSWEGVRATVDYFNTNAKCPIYTRGGHQLTQILQVEEGLVVPSVPIEVITEKAYQTRVNKGT